MPARTKKSPVRKTAAKRTAASSKTKKSAKKKVAVRKIRSKAKPRIVARRQHALPNYAPSRHFVRHDNNPIIEPREGNSWESKATFNPGVIFLDGGAHILYRAIGDNDMSVLGYARAGDGVTIDERSDEPVFVPKHKSDARADGLASGAPLAYNSGGGWNGGVEDPRLTRIGDRIYMTYTAFDGWGSLRMAMTSISVEDFAGKKWKWKKPVLISPEGEIHKNWGLFPEKINGKFAILTGIVPEIFVSYIDDIDNIEGVIKSDRPQGPQPGRKGHWDNIIRGAGSPPIKTKYGWLLFYHAMDRNDPNRYKLGAMLLDLNNPTKVLARASRPLLQPDEYYENHGFKGGVIYSCGAGIINDRLFVYYGGADTVVCVATADLDTFLKDLKETGHPSLQAVSLPKKINARRSTL